MNWNDAGIGIGEVRTYGVVIKNKSVGCTVDRTGLDVLVFEVICVV
jgi:hypothetical protein